MNLGPIAKAVVGAVLAGVAPYTAALLPTSQAGGRVSLGEWLTVLVAVLVASGLVWSADNVRWFPYAKAISAAVVTLLGPLVVVLLAGGTPTQADVLNALVQVAITFGVVSQVPNAGESEWHDPIGGDGADEPTDDQHTLNVDEVRDAVGEEVDEDGDGRDDRTGRYLPGNRGGGHITFRPVVPGGALALILGGAQNDFRTR